MNNDAQKGMYVLAGTRKYARIAIYRNDEKIGYLTYDGYISSKVDEAGWFDVKGDMAEEAKALQLLYKRHPLMEIDMHGENQEVEDWDY